MTDQEVRLFSGYGELNCSRETTIADVVQMLEDGSLQECVRAHGGHLSPWEPEMSRSRTGCKITVAHTHGFEVAVLLGGKDQDVEDVEVLSISIVPDKPYTDRFLDILPTREALLTAERLIREGSFPLINDENRPRREDPAHVAMLSHAYFDEKDRYIEALKADDRRYADYWSWENKVVDTRLTDGNPFAT